MAEVRNNWEGRTINGVFPLRRFLGSSNHSSVFLTESPVEGFLNAAIKLVPADPQHSQVQLWQWKTAATFSHPNLMRLLDSGQCELDGELLLYVVMEYAEESLSQILPYRALGPDEVQELLVPTLDALAFLHRENWIQGQLKPSNFLVVNDQLKLAVDTIRPVGVSQVGPRRSSIYEAPESEKGEVSAATDVWALGITITEALTQYPPTWLGGRTDPPTFPTNLPAEFADTVRKCLSPNPAERPTVRELQAQTRPGGPAPVPATIPAPVPVPAPVRPAASAPAERAIAQAEAAIPPSPAPPPQIPEPPMRADVRAFSEYEEESKRSVLVPTVIALAVLGGVVWGGMKLFQGASAPHPLAGAEQTGAEQTATEPTGVPAADTAGSAEGNTPPASSPPAVSPPPPAGPAPAASSPAVADKAPTRAASASAPTSNAGASGTTTSRPTARTNTPPPAADDTSSSSGSETAVHEEIPTVSASSRSTIHGHVRVSVRVTVDSSGRVIRDNLDNASSSSYFNRVASEAARKWRFAAAGDNSRQWVLRFEFGRDGTTVHAVGPRS